MYFISKWVWKWFVESSVLPRYYLLLQRVLNTAYLIKSFLNTSRYIILKCYPRTYSLSFCLQDNGLSKSSTISSSTAEAMRRWHDYYWHENNSTPAERCTDDLFNQIPNYTTLQKTIQWIWESCSSCSKRSHQWCLTLTPSNTETIERMTCHCFLRPIRSDLTSSSYIPNWNLMSAQ